MNTRVWTFTDEKLRSAARAVAVGWVFLFLFSAVLYWGSKSGYSQTLPPFIVPVGAAIGILSRKGRVKISRKGVKLETWRRSELISLDEATRFSLHPGSRLARIWIHDLHGKAYRVPASFASMRPAGQVREAAELIDELNEALDDARMMSAGR